MMDGKVDQVEMKAVLLMADRSTGWRDDPWMAYLSTEPMDVALDWMDAEMMVDVALALMDVAWVSTDVA